MKTTLDKAIFQVVLANSVNVFVALCNGFFLPKFLPISEYADYKAFMLFVSYVGVLHLGYVDGVYLQFGGKKDLELDEHDVYFINRTLLSLQIAIVIGGIVVATILNNKLLVMAVMCALPLNMLNLYKHIYQAIGEFKKYRRVLNAQSVSYLIVNLVLLFCFNAKNGLYYCGGYLAVNYIIFFVLYQRIYRYKYRISNDIKIFFTTIKKYISNGCMLMIGNFMSILIMNMDLWFVKYTCHKDSFAYYSFAVSLLKLTNVVFGAFSIALYPFICRMNDRKEITTIRKIIMVVCVMALSCSFIFRIAIDLIIDEYRSSKKIIVILMMAQVFSVLVNAIYLNLYKAFGKQKSILKIIIEVMVVSFFTNAALGLLSGFSMEFYAYATLVTMIVWLIRCQIELSEYRISVREWLYLVIMICVYVVFNLFFNGFGFFGYLVIALTVSFVFWGKDLKGKI